MPVIHKIRYDCFQTRLVIWVRDKSKNFNFLRNYNSVKTQNGEDSVKTSSLHVYIHQQ